MKFSFIIKLKVLILVLAVSLEQGQAQTDLASPYTIYGPGLPNIKQSAAQAGLGGSGVALYDSYRMNISNPAIVAYHLDPIFETAGKGSFSTFSTDNSTSDNRAFLLNNLNLSFPIKRGSWGMVIGLLPLTTVGYSVVTNSFNPELDTQPVANYSGSGGISQGYIGTGFKLYNRVDTAGNVTSLAFGTNLNFNFGTIDKVREISFPGDPISRGLYSEESILTRDFNLEFGIHYQKNIIDRTISNSRYLKLLLGATYAMGTELNAEVNAVTYNFRGTNALSPGDTLSFLERQKGTLNYPSRLSLGLGIDYLSDKKARLRFAADYTIQNWSDYEVTFSNESLGFDFQDSERFSAGLEYTPEVSSSNYFKVMEYRAGFYYEKSSLNLRNTEVDDLGMSFGLTMPIHRRRRITYSAFHISGQLGTFGTTENGLIQDDYYRIFVGFSFTPHFRNRWFVQPKYD
jgi:hypothetical protein